MDYRGDHAFYHAPGLPARLYHPDGTSVTGHLYFDKPNIVYNTGSRTVQLAGTSIQKAVRVTGYLDSRQNVFNIVLRDFLQLQFQILIDIDIEWLVGRIDQLGVIDDPPRPAAIGQERMNKAEPDLLVAELSRMGASFDVDSRLRISEANENYSMCPSYPKRLVVPTIINDKDLESVAQFRKHGRIPVVCYRHPKTGSLLVRASQPMVGCGSKRRREHRDEHYVQALCMEGYKAHYEDLPMEARDVSEPDSYSYGMSDSIGGGISNSLGSTATGFMAAAASSFSLALSNFASPSNGGPGPRLDSPTGSDFLHTSQNRTGTHPAAAVRYYILDTRSAKDAKNASIVTGGGVGDESWYVGSALVHLNLGTSAELLESYEKLRAVCSDGSQSTSNWLYKLEASGWMRHVQNALQSAVFVVKKVEVEGRTCMLQDDNGWGSVGVVSSLVQVMLDPYYRTIQGLRLLIQKEWISFGYPFCTIRKSHGTPRRQGDGPQFLLFIDCLAQMARQFPAKYEYTDLLLRTLVLHIVCSPNPTGPFSCDNNRERHTSQFGTEDDFWGEIGVDPDTYTNPCYRFQAEAALPMLGCQALEFWSALYSRWADASRESYMACEEVYPHRKESLVDKTDRQVLNATNGLMKTRKADLTNLYRLEEEMIKQLENVDLDLAAEVLQICQSAPHSIPSFITATAAVTGPTTSNKENTENIVKDVPASEHANPVRAPRSMDQARSTQCRVTNEAQFDSGSEGNGRVASPLCGGNKTVAQKIGVDGSRNRSMVADTHTHTQRHSSLSNSNAHGSSSPSIPRSASTNGVHPMDAPIPVVMTTDREVKTSTSAAAQGAKKNPVNNIFDVRSRSEAPSPSKSPTTRAGIAPNTKALDMMNRLSLQTEVDDELTLPTKPPVACVCHSPLCICDI